MCVVALAYQAHPDWPLILIGNRDEFHARPAAPLGHWEDGSGIVAGRDLQAGGTWLGVHQPSGRVVVVTNVRGAMPDPTKESRGALVVDMLRGEGRFADPTADDLPRFNAFNLYAVGDGKTRLLTNRPVPLTEGPRRGGDAVKLVSGSEKAIAVLGWSPARSTLPQMIGDAWRWHQNGGYGA